MGSFERFAAWRVGYDLTLNVFEVTDSFPSHERFGLVSQMRRAAFSVVANIAEAHQAAWSPLVLYGNAGANFRCFTLRPCHKIRDALPHHLRTRPR